MQTPVLPVVKTEDSELAQINIRSQMPEFWTDQPRLWFGQFEALIAESKRGEKSKFNIVIGRLSKDVAQHVSDLIEEPPEDKPYTVLKERLLSEFEESDTRKMQKLLTEMELGDQKPSHLLHKMKNLARGKLPEHTLRIMWISHLPAAARTVLTISEVTDLNKLAQQADKIIETAKPCDAISEVTSNLPSSSTETIIAEIAKLTKRFDEMQRGEQSQRSQSRLPRRYRNNDFSQRRDRKRPEDWVCYYHFRFGKRATRCEQPCNWKNSETAAEKRNAGNEQ